MQFIKLNERAYKYIRQFTIKSAEDALVELITNCYDAYNKSNIIEKWIICIEYSYDGSNLRVYDNACGLSGKDLGECMLQVGNYTNTQGSRGFFSRGAKDISAIGNITFKTIKDNKYSECVITSEAYGDLTIIDKIVTDEQREQLCIPLNGLSVNIKLLQSALNNVCTFDCLLRVMTLRSIFSDSRLTVLYRGVNCNAFQELKYVSPVGTMILDLKYKIPDYENEEARLILYISDNVITQPYKENEMEFGILVRSLSTIYDNSIIGTSMRWHPYIDQIYGELQCESINKLLLEYDKHGETLKNPAPIIDPSRITGLNRHHPFIKSLLSICNSRLEQTLLELNHLKSEARISNRDMCELLDELSLCGSEILDSSGINIAKTSNYESKLNDTVNVHRSKYVITELNSQLTNKNLLANNNKFKLTGKDQDIHDQLSKLNAKENDIFILNNNLLIKLDMEGEINASNILKVVPINMLIDFKNDPYIYRIDGNGFAVKIYVYGGGTLQHRDTQKLQTKMENKFKIGFISEPNYKGRYKIEYSTGVTARINISVCGAEQLENTYYMLGLLREIIGDVILEGEILSGFLRMDSDNYSNIRKANYRRNEIIGNIEPKIQKLEKTLKLKNINIEQIVG